MISKMYIICMIFCLLTACAPADEEPSRPRQDSGSAGAISPGSAPSGTAESTDLTESVRRIISENPDIVLQVIRENPDGFLSAVEPSAEKLYTLVEIGAERRSQSNMREEWERQAANPLTPVIDPGRPRLGPANAPITIVEYSDFECPYCSQASETVHDLLEKYPELLNLYYKHLPLKSHDNALTAAEYYEAAALQGHDKAWLLYERFFGNQEELSAKGEEWILGQAAELGLDVELLKADAGSPALLERIQADTLEARDFGAKGTPFFIVGGVALFGAMPEEGFEELISYLRQVRGLDQESPGASDQAPELETGQGQNATDSQNGREDGSVCLDCLSREG